VSFRDRLLGTLQALQPVLDEPGVLVVGSEVPNLLQPDASSTLVVSQDVDIAVPVTRVAAVRDRLRGIAGLVPSTDEPSIYVPTSPALIEANFLGLDASVRDAADTYVLEDGQFPLMVFGPLGLLRPGPVVSVEGLRIPLPQPGDLMVEKLVTDRTGEKGVRDLLVVAGILASGRIVDVDEVVRVVRSLTEEAQDAVRANLTVLSLLEPAKDMPDPVPLRPIILHLLQSLEA
jgi:hypothetical protein